MQTKIFIDHEIQWLWLCKSDFVSSSFDEIFMNETFSLEFKEIFFVEFKKYFFQSIWEKIKLRKGLCAKNYKRGTNDWSTI